MKELTDKVPQNTLKKQAKKLTNPQPETEKNNYRVPQNTKRKLANKDENNI